MQTKTDHELRTIAAEFIRDMNKVTGTTTAEQARMLGLHKANVAACVNQGRVENLGWKSIGRLLRTYGFEVLDKKFQIQKSQACPSFLDRTFTDEVKAGLKAVVNTLRSLGMECVFYPFAVNSEISGDIEVGGILFAQDDGKREWACIALSGAQHGGLASFFTVLECLAPAPPLAITEEQFQSWCDSTPHRSEVISYLNHNKVVDESTLPHP